MARSAVILGASGLVGSQVLRLLLAHPAYGKVTAVVRRKLDLKHDKLVQALADLDRLAEAGFPEGEDIFCCLGTTLAKAGSQEAFRKVDRDYPLAAAKAALARGARQFLIVTAVGADPRSPIFYNRVKGEVEQALAALPFLAVHVFRPSMLLGERPEGRPKEKLGRAFMRSLAFLMAGPLRIYRPIEAETVARAMVRAAQTGRTGVSLYGFDDMRSLSGA